MAKSQSVQDLDAALNDLNGELRALAFSVATARVWRAVQAHGIHHVVANLDKPEVWTKDLL